MIIVRDVFICKPGNASKVAKMFKEAMGGQKEVLHILTDMTGQYNKVVMVSQYESLAEFEKSFDESMRDSKEMREMGEKMKGYQDMYIEGYREIYRVW